MTAKGLSVIGVFETKPAAAAMVGNLRNDDEMFRKPLLASLTRTARRRQQVQFLRISLRILALLWNRARLVGREETCPALSSIRLPGGEWVEKGSRNPFRGG
jgi:hypothetical protein